MKVHKWLPIFFGFLVLSVPASAQQVLRALLDSIVTANSTTPFNGIVQVTRNGAPVYSICTGYADPATYAPLKPEDEFVIGSISKQFTAVLVLQQVDQGHLNLFLPISRYMPELKQSWADSVTADLLLTHKHGIVSMEEPLEFEPGSKFSYSQIGYDLLAQLVARVSGKPFPQLAKELFKSCGMQHTYYPTDSLSYHLVQGSQNVRGITPVSKTESLSNYPAAGGFISTAGDLLKWNAALHSGQLLSTASYEQMCSQQPGAVRNHPVFGTTYYGYGITVTDPEHLLQLGQTGYAPGFSCMDYYFPASKTSVVILSNIAHFPDELALTFSVHKHILDAVVAALKTQH